MSRIALIGQNSVEYVDMLVNIWNNGDCAVLIDCQIPSQTAVLMMYEAKVKKCYVEQKYYEKMSKIIDESITLIPYIRSSPTAQLLPSEIYDKFRNNYSRDEAIVIYSSGTTGKSKGIILSHFAINTNADAIINYMKPCNNDCMYIVKNLTHSSSITGELLVALKMKIDLLITPTIVPPRYTLMNIEKYGVTILCINPTLLKLYVDDIKKNNKKYDLSALKKIYVNGAKADKKLILGAQNTLINQQIYYEYGLSEAGPRVASQALGYCNIHSVGKPIMGVQVKILKENGETAAINEHGIIHVLTPSKYEKYILGEVKYSSLYKDWLNTGDIGYIDENEELHVLSRIDSLIIKDAHKIYPFEVEEKIQSLADISECVVTMVTVQDRDKLCCLYSSETEIPKDIVGKLGNFMMKYEIPKVFVRIDKLPKTANGKIAKLAVEEILLRELERR